MHDLVIVGTGPAGLAAAEFAAGLGLRVAAVDRGRLGGHSLWSGSVPSKALLASANVAHIMRTAHTVGVAAVEPAVDLAAVWRRVRTVQADIAATDDNPQRYRNLGIELVTGEATLTSPTEVTVRNPPHAPVILTGRYVLLCTGSRPHVPTIDGLDPLRCFTSDNFFQVHTPPASIAVIGGGPMGVEMAQALQRLGVDTTIFQRSHTLLPHAEPTMAARLTAILRAEGVEVHCTADVRRLEPLTRGGFAVHATVGNDGRTVRAQVGGVLVAAGRIPNVEGLGLDTVGIEVATDGITTNGIATNGITTNDRGRTAVSTVYAVGDVAGSGTHANTAAHDAVRAVRDMFFPGRRAASVVTPSCTFTDPELASVGLTADQAEHVHGSDTDVWRIELTHNDRARASGRTDGAVMVITAKGRVVGAHVLAPGAGEMIHELAMAVQLGLRLEQLSDIAHAYPTLSSAIGQVADESAHERAHRLRWLMKRR